MAFGLCNAPGTFQRSMEYVLRDLLWLKILVYLDDCLVIGETFEVTLANLREVFQRFKKYNLKMKPKKCELFQRRVNYLGRSVSPEGITLKDEHVEAM